MQRFAYTPSSSPDEDRFKESVLGEQVVRLTRMLARAEAVEDKAPALIPTLTQENLRGWSFVTSGSLLLHCSPYQHDIMRGRYALAHDNALIIAECIEKAVALFQGPLPKPNRILALDQHGAMLLGSLLSHKLQVPIEAYTPLSLNPAESPGSLDSAPALLIAYSFSYLPAEIIESLHQRSPQQLLWVHATPHSTHGLPAPDIISFWCRELLPIWENSLLPAPQGDTKRNHRQHLSRGELIRAVQGVSKNDITLEDLREILEIGAIAKSLGHMPVRREQLWASSPVASRER